MKRLIFLILALGIFTTSQLFAQKTGNNVVCFKSSMDCENCQITLTEYLKFEKGVKDLKVDLSTNTVMIEYKEGKNSDEHLIVHKGLNKNEARKKAITSLLEV